jgi:hypothetical protein
VIAAQTPAVEFPIPYHIGYFEGFLDAIAFKGKSVTLLKVLWTWDWWIKVAMISIDNGVSVGVSLIGSIVVSCTLSGCFIYTHTDFVGWASWIEPRSSHRFTTQFL